MTAAIINLEVLPSMRALMTAGPALERDNLCAYNCSFMPVDDLRAFDETLYILMNGVGVGFSVERNYIDKLPEVAEEFKVSNTKIVVEDSKAGWARGLRELIALLYQGQIPSWDLSKIRPAGQPLKTFGGRASGPAPLEDLFRFCVSKFQKAAGRQLYPIEVHDIMCKIGEVVVVGGVRRSALISLSNVQDDAMRNAKSGSWWDGNPQRALANNSAVYKGKPDLSLFLNEFSALYNSKSGERGFFNRKAAQAKAAEKGLRDPKVSYGTNPCGEIILRPQELCNLTEVVVREGDDFASLSHKVRLATILGTWQSSLTNFKYVRSWWKKNCEEERLLGVSLTGIYDNPLLLDDAGQGFLPSLRATARETNNEWAALLNINPSAAITTVKPSGTVSQLVNAASGIHPRYASYYIRRVRGDVKDPLTKFMIDKGIPNEPCVFKPKDTVVFSFPIAAPRNALTRKDISASAHFADWAIVRDAWCDHNSSITISVKEDEWLDIAATLYGDFDRIVGLTLLPESDHTYQQAPYEEITAAQYEELAKGMPTELDWKELGAYEEQDRTISSQNFACTGDSCELVDIASA